MAVKTATGRRPLSGPSSSSGPGPRFSFSNASLAASKRTGGFGHLKLQLWRLEAFLTLFIVALALFPPSVFFVLELAHLRERTADRASQIAATVRLLVEQRGLDMAALASVFKHDIEPGGILSIELVGKDGKNIVQVGDAVPRLLPLEIALPLTPPIGSVNQLHFMIDDRLLLRRAFRVIGIHFLVAALLGSAIFKIGVRPLSRAVDELESIQAQLIHSEKLSAIGEIYAGLAHEINNPLGIILSRLHLLETAAKERDIPSDLLPDLEMIHRHSSRIAEIIRGLLAFARRTSFEMARTDLNNVIDDTVSIVEKPFAKQRIRIERCLSRELPPVVGSPVHLQQVFVNLLNNARDAMPQGGIINLRTHSNWSEVMAEVQDSGTGIAADTKGKIFEPFFTTKGAGRGTGLGLSVSYGIIRTHGGDIEVESAPGKGALFRIRLPIDLKNP